jgi:hypothetical protein
MSESVTNATIGRKPTSGSILNGFRGRGIQPLAVEIARAARIICGCEAAGAFDITSR